MSSFEKASKRNQVTPVSLITISLETDNYGPDYSNNPGTTVNISRTSQQSNRISYWGILKKQYAEKKLVGLIRTELCMSLSEIPYQTYHWYSGFIFRANRNYKYHYVSLSPCITISEDTIRLNR